MTKRNIQKYTQNLRNIRDRYIGKVSNNIQEKINNIVDLYEDRKIVQFGSANKLIDGLTAKDNKKGLKAYETAVSKAEGKERVSEKQQEALKKAREGKKIAKAGRILRRIIKKTPAERIQRAVRSQQENRKAYSIEYIFFSREKLEKGKNGVRYNGRMYYPLLNPVKRSANVKAKDFIEKLSKRMITLDDDRFMFKKVLNVLRTDDATNIIDYITAVRIEKIVDVDDTQARDIDIREERLRNSSENISIYHRYIETVLDTEFDTIKDAIQNQKYRENECWINALVDTYEGTDLMRVKRGKLAKTLSREKVLELLEMSEEEFVEKGASINQMDVVFKHFSIPVRLYNFNSQIIYRHDPTTQTNIRIVTFSALIKNNHIYTINHDIQSLRQIAQSNEFQFKTSSSYYLSDRKEPIQYKAFNNIDELMKLNEEEEYDLIQKENDMAKVVHQFTTSGYEPYVRYVSGMICSVRARFRYKNLNKTVHYNIVAQNLSKQSLHTQVVVSSEDKYNRMVAEMFRFNKSLFVETHKSKFNEDTIRILDECRTVVPSGYFMNDVRVKKLKEIDMNKAFTNAFQIIEHIPTLSAFDTWIKYRGEDINKMSSLTLYYVEAFEGNVFFNKKYNLVYGYILKKLMKHNVRFKIHHFVQPSNKHKVNYKKIVDDLWEAFISEDAEENRKIKKSIANINFGLLEKSHNTAQISKIFNSLRECCYYQSVFGGKVHTVSEQEQCLIENDDEELISETRDGDKTYYILNVSDTKKLTDGFRLIKEMLLQNHNFSMFTAFMALKEKNVRVYSVKCDAFTVHRDDVDLATGHRCLGTWIEGAIDVGKGIGQWKVEKDKQINFPVDEYKYKFNEFIDIKEMENETSTVRDEWETEEICRMIEVKNPCIIRGKYPGTGKSHIAEHFQKLGKKVCMVVPNNRQLQERKGVEAVTYNRFFSVAVDVNDKLPAYDYEPFDVICFDEVYMCNMYMLNKVRLFCLKNPDKIIIGTGDIKQLPSIERITNLQDIEAYADHCMNVIFKYNIFLKICKRVGGKDTEEGDRNRKDINDMYEDFWIHKMPIEEFVRKYFQITDDIMASEHNIAYTNIRCRNVASEVRKRLGIKEKYVVGDVLISRKWVKSPRVNINLRYRITKMDEDKITLQNISNEKDRFTLTEVDVDSVFIYSYCATCHSSQGASINKTMTIHEWDKPWLVSREWVWTSLTRCVDFRNVRFFLNKDFDKEVEVKMMKKYFENKIEGYKGQDMRASRKIDDEDYVDVKWCLEKFRGNCEKCNVKFDFETKGGKLCSNFTAQRVCNETGHYKSNIVPWCRYCNCSAK